MKITVRPHQDFVAGEWACVPEFHGFVFSLGSPVPFVEDWDAGYVADVDPEGTVAVFNMDVGIPKRLRDPISGS